MADVCYFCGNSATSREHVPPACLFPEQKDLSDGIDYRKNLITVPSCDEHNSQKSQDDEYLQLVLIHGYFNNKAGRNHYKKKIVRAISRRPYILANLFANKIPVLVSGKRTSALDIDIDRFNITLERVCQGLCVYLNGERWLKEIDIYTPLLLAMDQPYANNVNRLVTDLCKSVKNCLNSTKKHGSNPDIFWYQLSVDKKKDSLLCRMVFYGGFDVFAVSDPHLRSNIVV